jgi:hypothetical protein
MDSSAIKAAINSKTICLATPLVLDSLFNQLCPGYSKEPHTALNHIRQTYEDTEGNTIFSSVYNYYTQILTASCPFMDQETLPVSICQAFINGLNSRLSPGFQTHFPDYSKSQYRNAIHQQKVLEEMHQAALRAKSEYNNIRAIASKLNGFGGQAFSAQANASKAEKTFNRYSRGGDDTGSNKSSTSSQGPLHCYGRGGPHPWSLLENRIHVIKCPNANNPGILDNTKNVIERIRNKHKKKQQDFMKRKNLATTNYSNFDEVGRERIRCQVLNSVFVASKTVGIALSITGVTGVTGSTPAASSSKSDQKRVVFLYDAKALSSNIHRPIPPDMI